MPTSDNFADTIRVLAPTGGAVAGTMYRIGTALGLAMSDASAGQPFTLKIRGIVRAAPKLGATGQAMAAGAIAYWDVTNKRLTVTASGNKNHGVTVVEAAASTATTVDIHLPGLPAA